MNLENAFETLEWFLSDTVEAAHFLDLTLLDPDATAEQLQTLEKTGAALQTAALCVQPYHLPLLSGKQKRAIVVNFPEGNHSVDSIFKILDEITPYNVQEIDYVFPWQDYLAGNTSNAIEHCRLVVNRVQAQGLCIKVIMETGAFPQFSTLLTAALQVLETDCDFLKTSTGKIAKGATPDGSFGLLAAIKESGKSCGIKFSGGIKSRETAVKYLKLAALVLEKELDPSWVRIGASMAGAVEIARR